MENEISSDVGEEIISILKEIIERLNKIEDNSEFWPGDKWNFELETDEEKGKYMFENEFYEVEQFFFVLKYVNFIRVKDCP